MENVRQLSGEGIDGMEDCPPLYHVDFSEDEFERIRKNPKSGLAALGAEALASIGLTPESDVSLMVAKRAYPGAPAAQDDAGVPTVTHVCCYVIKDELTMVCHRHIKPVVV